MKNAFLLTLIVTLLTGCVTNQQPYTTTTTQPNQVTTTQATSTTLVYSKLDPAVDGTALIAFLKEVYAIENRSTFEVNYGNLSIYSSSGQPLMGIHQYVILEAQKGGSVLTGGTYYSKTVLDGSFTYERTNSVNYTSTNCFPNSVGDTTTFPFGSDGSNWSSPEGTLIAANPGVGLAGLSKTILDSFSQEKGMGSGGVQINSRTGSYIVLWNQDNQQAVLTWIQSPSVQSINGRKCNLTAFTTERLNLGQKESITFSACFDEQLGIPLWYQTNGTLSPSIETESITARIQSISEVVNRSDFQPPVGSCPGASPSQD